MSLLYLDVTAVTNRADELESLNEELLSQIGVLNDTEERLSSMWEGDAKEAFRQAYRSDAIQMKNFYNAIRIYVQQLRFIIECYKRYEAFNREIATQRNYY